MKKQNVEMETGKTKMEETKMKNVNIEEARNVILKEYSYVTESLLYVEERGYERSRELRVMKEILEKGVEKMYDARIERGVADEDLGREIDELRILLHRKIGYIEAEIEKIKAAQEEAKMKNIERALERDMSVEEKVRVIHAEYFNTDDETKDLGKAVKFLEDLAVPNILSGRAHKASNIVLEQLKKMSEEIYYGHNIIENGVFYAETFIMTDLVKMLSDLEEKGNISGHADMKNDEISDALLYELGVENKAQAVDMIENNGLSYVENLDEDEISPRVAYEILTRLEIMETLELISLEIGEPIFPRY